MKAVQTDAAPKAIGPYSQAMEVNGLLFVSGQLGLDPATMEMAGPDVETQATQVLQNMQAVLDAAGLSKENVVKTTIFLMDMGDFPKVNAIYGEFFGEHKPARSTVQVAKLPLNGAIEIECIAAG